jgi:hypothetical protein
MVAPLGSEALAATAPSSLRGLPPATLTTFAASAQNITNRRGSTIHREGEATPHLDLAVSGARAGAGDASI